jgi:type IV pilus assembly protein PilM
LKRVLWSEKALAREDSYFFKSNACLRIIVKIGKQRILSIDLGSTKIRICDIQRASPKFKVTYYDELEIPSIVEDKSDFFRTEGRAFIKRQPSNSFYVSLPGRGILIRTLTIPKVPLKKVRDILKYEVQQQIPFPLEMVEWKYQILSEEGESFNILLAAAKKELINEFLSSLSMLGIDYAYLDTDLFAYFNAFRFSQQFNSEKCQAILEIGANSSNLIINHKEKILMRSLTTAGETITNAIVEAETIPFVEAEDKKIAEGLSLPIVATSMENLNTEIQNSIDFWRFTQKGPEVEEIFLCGQSALFKNVKEFLQEKSRIPTYLFKVFSNFELNSQYSYLESKDIEFAVLTGVALRKNRQTVINLDMIPEEMERIREFRQNRPYIYISAIMAGLIAMTPTFFYNQDKAVLKVLLNEIEMSLQQYEKYKPEVDVLKGEIETLDGKQKTIKNITESKTIWLKRILDIGNSLPSSRIYIASLSPGSEQAPSGGTPPPAQTQEHEHDEPDDHGMEDQPEVVQPASPTGELSVGEEKVFTLKGEVIVTDIKSAFGDFKTFVSAVKELSFVDKTDILYCELNQQEEKLDFSLVISLK